MEQKRSSIERLSAVMNDDASGTNRIRGAAESTETSYRALIDHLHKSNVGEFIELPQIVVVGDTSSGKSSLLSSLAEIQFPVNDVLTTRCPIRLTMENKPTCRSLATVDITWHPTTVSPPHWQMRERLEADDVPSAVEEAQKFILATSNREMARDVVELHVQGPNLTDMTLVDLPGLVQATGRGESDAIVTEVTELLREYLKNERCLILVVQPANVDFHNSRVLSLASSVDPTRQRTFPVITKPDLIDRGSEHEVAELLLGNRTAAYKFGFHMVKCRGKLALSNGMTIAEGENEERRFFSVGTPWNSLEKSYFGVRSLRYKLHHMFIRVIETSVPAMLKDIIQKKDKICREISNLGPDPNEPHTQTKIWHTIESQIVARIETEVAGAARFSHRNDLTERRQVETVTLRSETHSDTIHGPDCNPSAESFMDTTWCSKTYRCLKQYGEKILGGTLATITKLDVGSSVYVYFPNGDVGEGTVIKIWEGGDYVFVAPTGSFHGDDRFFSSRNKRVVIPMNWDSSRSTPKEGDILEDQGVPIVVRGLGFGQTHIIPGAPCRIPRSATDDTAGTAIMAPPATKTATLKKPPQNEPTEQGKTEYHCNVDTFAGFCVNDVKRSSDWLETPIQQTQTHDLPCFMNATVFNSIVHAVIEAEWKPITLKCCQESMRSLNNTYERVINECIPRQFNRLAAFITATVSSIFHERWKLCELEINHVLEHESHPFTQNKAVFNKVSVDRLCGLKRRLSGAIMTTASLLITDGKASQTGPVSPSKSPSVKNGPNEMRSHMKQPSKVSSTGVSQHNAIPAGDTESEIGLTVESFLAALQASVDNVFCSHSSRSTTKSMADDILCMLDAYGAVASQRMADNIPMLLLANCKAASKDIQVAMRSIPDTRLQELLAEDEYVVARRAELSSSLEVLQNAEKTVHDLVVSKYQSVRLSTYGSADNP
jgi:GTPase SAR1 family protein